MANSHALKIAKLGAESRGECLFLCERVAN